MSALTPEQFASLSSTGKSDVLELEIDYSLRLLEMSKEYEFKSTDPDEIKRRSDEHAARWSQLVQERDNKIQNIMKKENP